MRFDGLLGCAALILCALLAACRPPPASLARTHPASPTVQANGLVRWIHREAGVLELHFECRPTTVEIWCRDGASTSCEARRRHAAPAACPAEVVTITTGWGASARATLSPDGLATFTVDLAGARGRPGNAPGPRNAWTVSSASGELAWRDDTDLSRNVARPPSPPPPPPPRPQRSYRATMLGVDLAILLSAPLVFVTVWDGGREVGGLLHVVAYLAAGPVIHHLNGSPRAGRSLVRRALYPVAGIAAGMMLGSALESCEVDDDVDCGLAPIAGAVLGTFVGLAGALAHDWYQARVDLGPAQVTPVINSDGEHVSVGLAGRF